MVTIITELSKYAMILSLAIYTVLGFRLVRRDEAGKKAALWQQNVLMFGMQFLGNLTLYLSTENEKILLFYIAQLGAFILFLVLQRVIYPNADQLLNHNMLLLLSVGILMLARLSFGYMERRDLGCWQWSLLPEVSLMEPNYPLPFMELRFSHRSW